MRRRASDQPPRPIRRHVLRAGACFVMAALWCGGSCTVRVSNCSCSGAEACTCGAACGGDGCCCAGGGTAGGGASALLADDRRLGAADPRARAARLVWVIEAIDRGAGRWPLTQARAADCRGAARHPPLP